MICQVETLLTKQLVKEYNTKGQCKSVFQCGTVGNVIIQVAHYFHEHIEALGTCIQTMLYTP